MFTQLPLHAKLLAVFALAQLPLMLLANALDWTRYASGQESQLVDVALDGSAISGPITAPAWFLVAIYLTSRRGRRLRLAGDLLVLLAGVLILGNGIASFFTDTDVFLETPQAILTLGSICFTLAGAAIAGTTLGSLLKRTSAVPAAAR